ncbi:MAG: phosphotransacetylase family protein [Acaryochloris sp. RU_4_1]|nr:phosphotransacetylase family protein [Acaryochloris sp. RU_4_1]NJR56878.1 phosphotransacetylase family protein [Acaryochloris sp. CRU_2_0]
MQRASKHLLIGSIEGFSGKSATILGLAQSLINKGYRLAYAKPLGTCAEELMESGLDVDAQFIGNVLGLGADQVFPTLLTMNSHRIEQRILGHLQTNYGEQLQCYQEQGDGVDLVMLEGPGALHEGVLFGLSLGQIAEAVDAKILLVSRFHKLAVLDALLGAQALLGDRLIGVVLNDVDASQQNLLQETVQSFLEAQHIPVLGVLPSNDLLRSVSVAELVQRLHAEVLCCHEFLDLMVEELTIGAMNVNSALKYFRQARNMAVVTGSDRTDLQLAALESSTHCLILTGHFPPNTLVLNRAKDLEIPVLLVDSDTLTTVEIVEKAFQQAQVHERVKIDCIQEMIEMHCDIERLLSTLGIPTPVPS